MAKQTFTEIRVREDRIRATVWVLGQIDDIFECDDPEIFAEFLQDRDLVGKGIPVVHEGKSLGEGESSLAEDLERIFK